MRIALFIGHFLLPRLKTAIREPFWNGIRSVQNGVPSYLWTSGVVRPPPRLWPSSSEPPLVCDRARGLSRRDRTHGGFLFHTAKILANGICVSPQESCARCARKPHNPYFHTNPY